MLELKAFSMKFSFDANYDSTMSTRNGYEDLHRIGDDENDCDGDGEDKEEPKCAGFTVILLRKNRSGSRSELGKNETSIL